MTKVRVLGIFPPWTGWDRLVVDGMTKWAAQDGNMDVLIWNHWHSWGPGARGLPRSAACDLKRYNVRGIITNAWDDKEVKRFRRLSTPVVDVGGTWPHAQIVSVHSDDLAVGRLAARHLLEKGIKSFGMWSDRVPLAALHRQKGFVDELAANGYSCSVIDWPGDEMPWSRAEQRMIAQWIGSISKPAGIFCWWDGCAVPLEYCCREIGLAVPDDIAIIGVSDDDVLRQRCPVGLSSIDTCPQNIGYKAMEVIRRMIRTGKRPAEPLVLPPGNVIARASTDVLAMDNAQLAEAVRFMQNFSHKPITVRDILRAVPISRRNLEVQCRKMLGRTPLQQIQRSHVERAKVLMADYDLSLSDVATMSGFTSHNALSILFKRYVGCTPGEYRRRLLPPNKRARPESL